MAKIALSKLTLEELVNLEKIAYKVVAKYENENRIWENDNTKNELFLKYKRVYEKVFLEMINRVDEIE